MTEPVSTPYNSTPGSCQCEQWLHLPQGRGSKTLDDPYENAYRGFTTRKGAEGFAMGEGGETVSRMRGQGQDVVDSVAVNSSGRFVHSFKWNRGGCPTCVAGRKVTDAY